MIHELLFVNSYETPNERAARLFQRQPAFHSRAKGLHDLYIRLYHKVKPSGHMSITGRD